MRDPDGLAERRRKLAEHWVPIANYRVGLFARRVPRVSPVNRGDLRNAALYGLAKTIVRFGHLDDVAFAQKADYRIWNEMIDELRLWDFASGHRRYLKSLGKHVEAKALSAETLRVRTSEDPEEDGVVLQTARTSWPDARLESRDIRRDVWRAVNRLPKRQREAVLLYWRDNLSMRTVGEILGVSESRASQIHAEALQRLRSKLEPEAA